MDHLVRSLSRPCAGSGDPEPILGREWLVTNGLGGYASGTICGLATRRYHGWLIAALPSPLGRTMMLKRLGERLGFRDGTSAALGVEAILSSPSQSLDAGRLVEFRLEAGLPVWRYEVEGRVLEKRLLLPHLQNTSFVTYRLLSGGDPVQLILRPWVHFRSHDAPVDVPHPGPYRLTASEDRYELSSGRELPSLRMTLSGGDAAFTLDASASTRLNYAVEQSRGYEHTGDLWSPGLFRVALARDRPVTLVASAETWEALGALTPDEATRAERTRRSRLIAAAVPEARDGLAAELVLAADQFLMTPAGRVEDATRAHAAGEEIRSVIAGYHWFTDWGRDTMISLEGLTLTTGRHVEAGYILRTFAYYIRDGLIPNLFPEGRNQGLYHTADATLWFFHALDRYCEITGDRATLQILLPRLIDIVEHHLLGTRFGIAVDPVDGLLRQGQEGYQLTWMDAKVGDWVVTPRRGKAIEINALWYNALRLLEGWLRQARGDRAARPIAEHAERARRSFNQRFWYADGGYLYDVVDGERGDDPACRPNQVFAIAPRHPILDRSRWEPVLQVVRERLLTPVGLRSLAPGHPDYKARYYGDLRSRDAAYHQGTVWAWLIGPFIDAWLKVYPDDRAGARRFLEGFVPHLDEGCLGSISEIFDAEAPYTQCGCIAQAWSVAEVLRCWVKTAG
ncbi:MAG: amylo-alpha-1,6-glucosidase [Planctomycetaceae bacterium]